MYLLACVKLGKGFPVWCSSWVTLFTVMMSGYEIELYKNSHNPVFATILLVLFVFVMCVVLLNCLIALMSGTFEKQF